MVVGIVFSWFALVSYGLCVTWVSMVCTMSLRLGYERMLGHGVSGWFCWIGEC